MGLFDKMFGGGASEAEQQGPTTLQRAKQKY